MTSASMSVAWSVTATSVSQAVSEPAKQHRDDQDDHHEPDDAKAAATVVASRLAPITAAKSAEQQDHHQNYQKHGTPPSVNRRLQATEESRAARQRGTRPLNWVMNWGIRRDAASAGNTDDTSDQSRLNLNMADQIVTPQVRSFKFRLFTTGAQETALTDMLGAFCDLYNACLQQRIETYQRRGINLRYGNQAAELKAIRVADERLAGYSFSAEQQVLRRLDRAFSAFFGRVKRGGKAGLPRFRAKSMFDSADFRVGDGLTIRKSKRLGMVGIPGEIKVRWHRDLPPGAKVGAAIISRSCGKWYVYFQITLADAEPIERPFTPVGIDLGLTSLVALSNGETVPTPQHTRAAAKRLRRLQRAVSRCKRGSKRLTKAKLRVARHSAKTANQRRDTSHKLSRSLVDRFSHLAMEDLNIKGLAAGMLAKSVHNAAWNSLVQKIAYKAENAGGVLKLVSPRGTSQTCPECGTIRRKTLADRRHTCDCGYHADRDVAAARIVLMRANFGPGTSLQAPSQRIAA